VIALLSWCGCTPTERVRPADVKAPAALTAPPSARSTGPAPALIVAGAAGIFELGSAGEPVRRLGSSDQASYPRFLPGSSALVFVHQGTTLRRLEIATGTERAVAGPWQAHVVCNEDVRFELAVQAHEDVQVDGDGRHVCVSLNDRNVNMASIASHVRIELGSGHLEQGLTPFDHACLPLARSEPARCEPSPKAAPSHRPPLPYAFDSERHALLDTSGKLIAEIGDFELAIEAENDRYSVLRGNFEEGDYIHFQLLVLDRRTGELLPLPSVDAATAPAFPVALGRAELARLSRRTLGERAGDFVGEDTLRFHGPERLVAGKLLVLFGPRRLVALPGEVAF
jgi:hypothetical protein